jgi:hypothetical protein
LILTALRSGKEALDQIRVLLSSGNEKVIRKQVRLFLENGPLPDMATAADDAGSWQETCTMGYLRGQGGVASVFE